MLAGGEEGEEVVRVFFEEVFFLCGESAVANGVVVEVFWFLFEEAEGEPGADGVV